MKKTGFSPVHRLTRLLAFLAFCNLFLCHGAEAQRWHFTGSAGLIEQQTDNKAVLQNGSFLNGWRVSAGARRMFNRFYIQPTADFRVYDQEATTQIAVLKGHPANYAAAIVVPAGFIPYSNDHFNVRLFTGAMGQYLVRTGDNKNGITTESYNRFHFGPVLGLGFDFTPVYFDFHYEYGLNAYYRDPAKKANAFCFTLGALFN